MGTWPKTAGRSALLTRVTNQMARKTVVTCGVVSGIKNIPQMPDNPLPPTDPP